MEITQSNYFKYALSDGKVYKSDELIVGLDAIRDSKLEEVIS